MTLGEYQAQALTTLNLALDGNERLANLALGLCGETLELARVICEACPNSRRRIIDEAGDVMWYLVVSADALDCRLQPWDDLLDDCQFGMVSTTILHHLWSMCFASGEFGEFAKKVVFQGHPLAKHRSEMVLRLEEVFRNLRDILWAYRMPVVEVLHYNVSKLKERYPDGVFSATHSVQRAADMVSSAGGEASREDSTKEAD